MKVNDEIKPEATEEPKPSAEVTPASSTPNQTPVPEDTGRKIKELEEQLKERDAKLSDLSTTISTIQSRFDQVGKSVEGGVGKQKETVLAKAKEIMSKSAYDPDAAANELATLLSEMTSNVSEEAVTKATHTITLQGQLEKIRNEVKTSNPEFDDDIVDTVMMRADNLALTWRQQGLRKTPQEAIQEATKYVRAKLDAYASKKNATPPLPSGAMAETGHNPPPPAPKKEEPILTPSQELETRKQGLARKII